MRGRAAMLFPSEGQPGRRVRAHAAVALLLLSVLAGACASVGTGDPLVVRAEDILANGPQAYRILFTLHETPGVSALETKEIYEDIERLRKGWPAVDRALWGAVTLYKERRRAGAPPTARADLETAIDDASAKLNDLRGLSAKLTALRGAP